MEVLNLCSSSFFLQYLKYNEQAFIFKTVFVQKKLTIIWIKQKDAENHGGGKDISAYVSILERIEGNTIGLRYHATTPADSKFLLGKTLTRKNKCISFGVIDKGVAELVPRVRANQNVFYFNTTNKVLFFTLSQQLPLVFLAVFPRPSASPGTRLSQQDPAQRPQERRALIWKGKWKIIDAHDHLYCYIFKEWRLSNNISIEIRKKQNIRHNRNWYDAGKN